MDFRFGRRGLAIAAVRIALCVGAPARADLFSPGELARPHASLEGLSHCTQCHEKGQQLSGARCNACHAEIGHEQASHTGFHGKLGGQTCQSCHHEHQGRGFNLIEWGPKGESGFDHSATGFLLRGKHAATECKVCHQSKRVKDEKILALMAAHPGERTFLGLQTTCAACHFDEHRGQLNQPCAACHNEKAWKPAPGFDHATTGYALLGAHRRVRCEGCHAAEKDEATPKDAFPAPRSSSFAKFGDVAHQSCADCHADPHKGQFAQRCESCHTVESWTKVRNAVTDRAFHDKTRFPLRGAHLDVDCRVCHGPFPGQRARFRGLPFGACTDCHADAHEGQLRETKKQASNCERCHTLESFLPARFEVPEHAKTRYPLEGAHQAVACNGCHFGQPSLLARVPSHTQGDLKRKHRPEAFSLALFELLPKANRCDGCHADPHGGQFANRETPIACRSCHTLSSFHDLAFQHDRDTSFALTGKHAAVPCAGCHATSTEKKGHLVSRYRGTPTSCRGCHDDVHAGQFTTESAANGACERCHTSSDFTAPLFQHGPPFTRFTLTGKHSALACAKCHPKIASGAGATSVTVQRFKPLPQRCAGCHADPHRGSFKGMEP